MLNRIRKTFSERHGDEDSSVDHRRHSRRDVLIDAAIYPIDFFSDVTIHNVSASGFMGEADVELTVGETLHLTLDDKAYQAGTVRWTEGRLFGVSFENSLARPGAGDDLDFGTQDDHKPRARRSKLNIPARLCLGRPSQPATVRNLSQFGMLLETTPHLHAGQHILVKLGARPPMAGRIQWQKDDNVGVETAEPVGILSLIYSSD
jgi:hypothetical protein